MMPLAIGEVVLTNFKNYAQTQFILGEKINLISGLNGMGKTNLLDAIYYLSVGKSYFTPFDQRIVRKDESFFRLEGSVRKGDEGHKIIIKVIPGSIKELALDGILMNRISEHIGFIPIVFSAPRDIDLIFGSGQVRRRYFDHLLCQMDQQYLQALVLYNHLLLMRNAALKQGFPDLKTIIATYDEQMTGPASFIFEKRKWLVEHIRPIVRQTYQRLSEDREGINIEYESQLSSYSYEILADMNWEMDKNTTRTNAGIHKDDYVLSVKNMSAKEYGSQGQIKSLIFALHLSKYAVLRDQSGYKPILILDDIFDKLDERRLHQLTEILVTDDFGQIFISDTSSIRVGGFLPESLIHHIEML